MKKYIALLLCLLLVCAALPALAEMNVSMEILGEQMHGDALLHVLRFDFADGDRQIPSLYALVENTPDVGEAPYCELEDVNGDGHADLVIPTMIGASNTTYTFYLWDEEAGAFRWFGGEELWNYQLYPAQGLVFSAGASGWAGLLHEYRVYGWTADGKELKLLRSSTWDTLNEFTMEDSADGAIRYTERHDDSILVETYINYETGEEETFTHASKDYMEDEAFAAQRFLYEDDFLGLEVTAEPLNDGTNG